MEGEKACGGDPSPLTKKTVFPAPPPLPFCSMPRRGAADGRKGHEFVPSPTKDMWDRLFEEGYRADVCITTDNNGIINAHASVLGMASPVMRNTLKQAKSQGRKRSISIRGVPHQAIHTFIRYLYSSSYREEEMKKYALHLIVLSHVFVVPTLKQECARELEKGLITTENVTDIYQLAQLCDIPRLCLICFRLILKNFKVVSASEGWNVMKQSNPKLEKELVRSVVEADYKKQERVKKMEEKKIYLQLYQAMEALVHICCEGCRTIGPHDMVLKKHEDPCKYPACKGLESLIRHFAGCKIRVPGGCIQCKRMWQLLELHSRLCSQPDKCKVPLCRHFKEKMQTPSKKDEVKWRMLVSKMLAAKNTIGSFTFSSTVASFA